MRCIDCSGDLPTGSHGGKKYCDDCRSKRLKEEKKRYYQERVKPRRESKPAIIRQCVDCSEDLPIDSSKNKKRCDVCRDKRRREQAIANTVLQKQRYADGYRAPSHIARMVIDKAHEGFCPGCGEYSRLDRDHDHSCCPAHWPPSRRCGNCERGELCGNCNRALGLLKESTETLRNLIKYIELFSL